MLSQCAFLSEVLNLCCLFSHLLVSLLFLPSLAQIPPSEFSTLSHSNWLCQWLLTDNAHISFQPFGFSMKKAPLNDLQEKEVHCKTTYGLHWELDLVRGSSLPHYVLVWEVSALLAHPPDKHPRAAPGFLFSMTSSCTCAITDLSSDLHPASSWSSYLKWQTSRVYCLIQNPEKDTERIQLAKFISCHCRTRACKPLASL